MPFIPSLTISNECLPKLREFNDRLEASRERMAELSEQEKGIRKNVVESAAEVLCTLSVEDVSEDVFFRHPSRERYVSAVEYVLAAGGLSLNDVKGNSDLPTHVQAELEKLADEYERFTYTSNLGTRNAPLQFSDFTQDELEMFERVVPVHVEFKLLKSVQRNREAHRIEHARLIVDNMWMLKDALVPNHSNEIAIKANRKDRDLTHMLYCILFDINPNTLIDQFHIIGNTMSDETERRDTFYWVVDNKSYDDFLRKQFYWWYVGWSALVTQPVTSETGHVTEHFQRISLHKARHVWRTRFFDDDIDPKDFPIYWTEG